jgi:hypothetical protein
MPSTFGSWLWPIPDTIIFVFSEIINPLVGNLLLVLLVFFSSLVALTKIAKFIWRNQITTSLFLQIAIALSLLAPFWMGEIGTTFQSWLSAPFILLSLFMLLNANRESADKRKFVYIGILLGLGTAFKLTNYVFVLATLTCMVAYGVSAKFKIREYLKQFSAISVGFIIGIVPIIPWWIHTFISTGNPVFPFYNKFFGSSYYPQENFIDSRWTWKFPDSILNIPTGWALGTPVSELGTFDIRLVSLFALYGILLFRILVIRIVKNQLREVVKSNLIVEKLKVATSLSPSVVLHLWICSSTIFWLISFGYARYWIVVELLVGIAIADLLLRILQLQSARLAAIASIFLLASVFLTPINWNVSATPNFGTIEKPWDSPLTKELETLNGVLITQGSPTSFVRVTSPSLTHLIGIDFPNLPSKYKAIIERQIVGQKSLSFLTTTPYADPKEIERVINTLLSRRFNLFVDCQNYVGPIRIDYQLCQIKKANSKA